MSTSIGTGNLHRAFRIRLDSARLEPLWKEDSFSTTSRSTSESGLELAAGRGPEKDDPFRRRSLYDCLDDFLDHRIDWRLGCCHEFVPQCNS